MSSGLRTKIGDALKEAMSNLPSDRQAEALRGLADVYTGNGTFASDSVLRALVEELRSLAHLCLYTLPKERRALFAHYWATAPQLAIPRDFMEWAQATGSPHFDLIVPPPAPVPSCSASSLSERAIKSAVMVALCSMCTHFYDPADRTTMFMYLYERYAGGERSAECKEVRGYQPWHDLVAREIKSDLGKGRETITVEVQKKFKDDITHDDACAYAEAVVLGLTEAGSGRNFPEDYVKIATGATVTGISVDLPVTCLGTITPAATAARTPHDKSRTPLDSLLLRDTRAPFLSRIVGRAFSEGWMARVLSNVCFLSVQKCVELSGTSDRAVALDASHILGHFFGTVLLARDTATMDDIRETGLELLLRAAVSKGKTNSEAVAVAKDLGITEFIKASDASDASSLAAEIIDAAKKNPDTAILRALNEGGVSLLTDGSVFPVVYPTSENVKAVFSPRMCHTAALINWYWDFARTSVPVTVPAPVVVAVAAPGNGKPKRARPKTEKKKEKENNNKNKKPRAK